MLAFRHEKSSSSSSSVHPGDQTDFRLSPLATNSSSGSSSGSSASLSDAEYWSKLLAASISTASTPNVVKSSHQQQQQQQERGSTEKDKIQKDFQSLRNIASIAHGCDWLAKSACVLCLATVKQYQNHGSQKAQDRNSVVRNTFVGGSGSGSGSGSAGGVFKENGLLLTIQAAAKELSKLAEECLGVLRGEMQYISLYYIRQLTAINLLSAAASGAGDHSGVDSKLSVGSSTAGSSSSSSAISKTNRQHESDAVVSMFNHHLISMQDIMLATSASSAAFAVVLSPVVKLVPKLFMHCVLNASVTALSILAVDNYSKSAVACQQNLSMLLESTQFDPSVDRLLQVAMTDEFDAMKKFTSLLHHSAKEFMEYSKKNHDEFTQEEYRFVWKFLKEKYSTDRLID